MPPIISKPSAIFPDCETKNHGKCELTSSLLEEKPPSDSNTPKRTISGVEFVEPGRPGSCTRDLISKRESVDMVTSSSFNINIGPVYNERTFHYNAYKVCEAAMTCIGIFFYSEHLRSRCELAMYRYSILLRQLC